MSSHMIYQIVRAEQTAVAGRAADRAGRSPAPGQAAAQRAADERLGETAAAMAQLFRGVTRPITAVRAAIRHRRRRQPSARQPSARQPSASQAGARQPGPSQAGCDLHVARQR